MDSILDGIKAVLPVIGTALGGPLGLAAATFIGSKLGISDATVEKVTTALAGMTPEQLATYKQADNDFQVKMTELGYDSVYKLQQLNVQAAEVINKTMQVETTSEHWASWFWRPAIGLSLAAYINSLWILPLFHVQPITLPPELIMTIGGILGIASFFRGKAQADPAIQNTAKITQQG